VPVQQRLLRGVWIGAMEGVSGSHAPHREEVQLALLSTHFDDCLVPVHLRFLPWPVALRDEDLISHQTALTLALAHVAAYL